VVDDRLSRWADPPRFPEHRVQALRSVARVVAALPPEQVARQVTRVATRLAFGHAAVTEAVTDALSAAKDRQAWRPGGRVRTDAPERDPPPARLSTDPVTDRPCGGGRAGR
jgi:hypothetical protein